MSITISGYNTINGYVKTNQGIPITNLFAAYSVRKLFPNYSGYCLRVRRSSDGNEQNFGFASSVVGSLVDTASILTFCGAGNGSVVEWYDQFGTTDISNITLSEQPMIVQSGSLMTFNGRPGVFFGTNAITSMNLQPGNTPGLACPLSFSFVSQCVNIFSHSVVLGGRHTVFPYDQNIVIGTGGTVLNPYLYSGATNTAIYFSEPSNELLNTNCCTLDGSNNGFYYRNNILKTSGSIGSASLSFGYVIGNGSPGNLFYNNVGPIMEFLIYSSILTNSQRSFIHYDQRDFFNTLIV